MLSLIGDLRLCVLMIIISLLSNRIGRCASLQKCELALPVYDEKGDPLMFKVNSVKPTGGKIELLTIKDTQFHVSARDGGLSFPASLIGRSIDVTLSGEGRERLRVILPLMHCQQRISLTYGEADSGSDVRSTSVVGRLSRCSLSGDWWVRAFPMFGGPEHSQIHEGKINKRSGLFHFESSFQGTRHIFVIGKGKNAKKTISADVIVGEKNDVGVIDLSDACSE